MFWFFKKKRPEDAEPVEDRIRQRYVSFRDLLSLNNECLEVMARIQEDLQFIPPRRAIVAEPVKACFAQLEATVGALERLTGSSLARLHEAVRAQQNDVERYIAACDELVVQEVAAWLGDVDCAAVAEVGGKAAWLGEIKGKLGLPVPDGFVLTAEAYRHFCGVPLWEKIRDATHNVDLNDLAAMQQISAALTESVMALPVPKPVEIAISGRAGSLQRSCRGFAVRSSAVGEGGYKTFAGQFLSLLHVPAGETLQAYKRVIAARFSERALFYRLSAGLQEVETPMAVLFLGIVPARAAGIMYTRDPGNPRSQSMWITATRGLGLDIASGRVPADLFILDRKHHPVLTDQTIVAKEEELVLQEGGGLLRQKVPFEEQLAPSLTAEQMTTLAEWGIAIEKHFKTPQDIEWVLDLQDNLWIVQSRNLVLAEAETRDRTKSRGKEAPLAAGGRTVYPGRVSGAVFVASSPKLLSETPRGAILFVPRPSPEIVSVFPRISGLVAEWGNIAGHAAALLREAKIPSVFQMTGVFERVRNGDAISLDAVQPRLYAGTFWPPREIDAGISGPLPGRVSTPITERLLNLNLLDPAAANFRPSGCRSGHDILRFCHEKAIETVFMLSDSAIESSPACSKKLMTPVPIQLYVLDLGGGLTVADPHAREVKPEEIVSRPFQALWRGVTNERVQWRREMPASFSDFASVMASSLTQQSSAVRALGESSYLLVADEYMNLNSRLAYHFSLVDACVSDTPSKNFISFRFAGGGAPRDRRDLRACFIDRCLTHFGYVVDRRGDLVNAWFKKMPAAESEVNLDILGRLMACSSQLDMYMTSYDAMVWYVRQFLAGNYSFRTGEDATTAPAQAAR